MEKINICYVINNNQTYIDLTLKSIDMIKKFFRSKEHDLNFYILSEEKLELPSDVINVISPYKNIPLLWQRMYISELIGESRVIFLDSDTIAYNCISKLWDIDIGDNIVGMSPHYCMPNIQSCIKHYKLQNYKMFEDNKHINIFYNAGVVLIDCKKWLEKNMTEKCLKVYEHVRDSNIARNDEPVYNIVLKDQIYELSELWNYFPRDTFKKANIVHYYGKYYKHKPLHDEFTLFPE
tara:strand:+ start:12858 stop:13565 length:708 start_codon:yes stop_codon:yes gene_type:complete